MSISSWARVSGLAASLSLIGSAIAQQYPSDYAKSDPIAMRAWRSIVPPPFKKQTWIYDFDGVETPIQNVTPRGKPFVSGNVCIPHDCGGNFVAFLVATDGSEAYGELASDELRVKQRYFGAPGPDARTVLDKLINQ